METIAVATQNKQVGKTSSTVNLGAALALAGQRVLIVDLDPQAQAGMALGRHLSGGDQRARSLGWAIQGRLQGVRPDLSESWFDRSELVAGFGGAGSLHLLACEESTMNAVQEVIHRKGYYATPVLRRMLAEVASDFDFTLIDTPSAVPSLSATAFAAADGVVTVCVPEYASLKGAAVTRAAVRHVKDRTGGECDPRYLGAIVNRSHPPSAREGQAVGFREALRDAGLVPFPADIRLDRRIGDSFALGVPAAIQFAEHPPGRMYGNLLGQVLARMRRCREGQEVPVRTDA
ncbi:ParA family protein [Streptomyces lavendulae]|uniref:ParA family protein n=1 Tax=Streptomyces lavendulae TaxID=1914 RepID=UPI0031EFBD29